MSIFRGSSLGNVVGFAGETRELPQVIRPGSKGDPFAAYGARGADAILRAVREAPQGEARKAVLRSIFDQVDPTLWRTVEAKTAAFKAKGLATDRAFRTALAASLSNGITKEIYAVGRNQMPRAIGLGGYGYSGLGHVDDELAGRGQLGFGWDDVNPVKVVKKVGGAVVGAGKAVGGTIVKGTKNAAGAVWDGTKWVGSGIKKGTVNAAGAVWDGTKWVAKKSYAIAKKGVDALGKLGCAAVNSGLASAAGAGVGAAYGGPTGAQVGATGVSAIQATGMCGAPASGGAVLLPPPPPDFPIIPIAIAGVGIVLLLALSGGRKPLPPPTGATP